MEKLIKNNMSELSNYHTSVDIKLRPHESELERCSTVLFPLRPKREITKHGGPLSW